MSNTPSTLRRAGAALGICILLGGTLSACAPRKTPPSPSPSATFNPHFTKSAELAANLQSLSSVVGDVTGTMTVGGEDRKLTGSVALDATGSRIRLVENGTESTTYSETIVDGNRYTSHDDKTWAYRGIKAKGQDLATLLANADTSLDGGVSTINKVAAHMIMTAPDKMDVAPALGLDPWTFDQETTTLHVWADDAGKVLGFGASMSWKLMIAGEWVDVTADLDVMLSPTKTLTITTPKDPWKWVQDTPNGFAYADPGDLLGVPHKITLNHLLMASSVTLSDDLKAGIDGLSKTGTVGGARSLVIDGEAAYWFTYDQSGAHEAILLVFHERMEHVLILVGSSIFTTKIDANAVAIFSTIQFTR